MPQGDVLSTLRNVLKILRRLLSNQPVSLGTIQEEVQRSDRTVRRYLKVLDEAGFKLRTTIDGRIEPPVQLVSEFRKDDLQLLLNLTKSELLLLYYHLMGLHHVGDQGVKDSLEEKLRGAFGVLNYDMNRLSAMLVNFDKAYKSYEREDFKAFIGTLIQAIYEEKSCQVTYQGPGREEPTVFRMNPYRIFEFDGGLYCYCHVPRFGHVRMLAIERIREIKINKDGFARDAGVVAEIERKQQRAFRIIDDEAPIGVKLRFTPDAAFYVKERIWHDTPPDTLTEEPDGGVVLTFEASGRFEIVRWILGWGASCEVLEPEELREEVKGRLKEAIESYTN